MKFDCIEDDCTVMDGDQFDISRPKNMVLSFGLSDFLYPAQP